jgi:hypothetical protein
LEGAAEDGHVSRAATLGRKACLAELALEDVKEAEKILKKTAAKEKRP